MYASGKTTGFVLDSGDGVTHCVPVYEGFSIPNAIMRMDLAGRDITDHLRVLMRKSGYNFNTSAERDIVRDMKEKLCYISRNPEKEEASLFEKSNKEIYTPYKLPDGSIVEVGPERFRAPEILFDPSIVGLEDVGIQQQVVNSIQKCDVDMRSTLYSNLILSGGSTMFPNFAERLLSEVHSLLPKATKVRIYAQPDRNLSTWAGGSILGALTTFKNMWVSHKEYEEDGVNVVHRKMFL